MSKRQDKILLRQAFSRRVRVHIGRGYERPRLARAIMAAFDGTCLDPTPIDAVRCRLHDVDADAVIAHIETAIPVRCLYRDEKFLVFTRR